MSLGERRDCLSEDLGAEARMGEVGRLAQDLLKWLPHSREHSSCGGGEHVAGGLITGLVCKGCRTDTEDEVAQHEPLLAAEGELDGTWKIIE